MEKTDLNALPVKLIDGLKNAFLSEDMVEKLLIALGCIVATFIAYKIIDALLRRGFDRRINKPSESDKKRLITFKQMTHKIAQFAFAAIGVMLVLSQFVNIGALITVAGIGTIAIGLGAQKLIEDLLSGFMILSENQFCVGDYVSLENGTFGKVETISMRTTTVRQLDGSLYIIQNGMIGKVLNFSKGEMILNVKVDVSYESDLHKVIEVMTIAGQRAFEKEGSYLVSQPEIVGPLEFADSGMVMGMLGHIAAKDKLRAEADLRSHIKTAFDEYQIEIPYNKLVLVKDQTEVEAHVE